MILKSLERVRQENASGSILKDRKMLLTSVEPAFTIPIHLFSTNAL